MHTDLETALRYAPIIHFDRNDPIPPRAVGYTVFRSPRKSASFPKREVKLPRGAAFTVEYAYYFDYDIGHMYDLEHIWVTIDGQGRLIAAQASFHGKYLVVINMQPTPRDSQADIVLNQKIGEVFNSIRV